MENKMDQLTPQEILDTLDTIIESLEEHDECTDATFEIAYLLREELVESFGSLLDDE